MEIEELSDSFPKLGPCQYGIVNTEDMLDAMNRAERLEAAQKAEAEAARTATQSQNSHTGQFQALGLPTTPRDKTN